YSAFMSANEKAARLKEELDEANEKVARLEGENVTLTSTLKECVGRALDLVPNIFRNALDQVELYLGRLFPRDRFSYKHYVKDGKLVPRTLPE
ncbi:hypothetical protein A2U01_0072088, partial [Trifolium medium]|nr:hypothetical protein [Trifolium medium]